MALQVPWELEMERLVCKALSGKFWGLRLPDCKADSKYVVSLGTYQWQILADGLPKLFCVLVFPCLERLFCCTLYCQGCPNAPTLDPNPETHELLSGTWGVWFFFLVKNALDSTYSAFQPSSKVWDYQHICTLASSGRRGLNWDQQTSGEGWIWTSVRPICDAMFLLSVQHSARFRSEGKSHFDMSHASIKVLHCVTCKVVHHIDNVSAQQYAQAGLSRPRMSSEIPLAWLCHKLSRGRVQGGIDLIAKLLLLSPRQLLVESLAIICNHHVHEAFCGASPATLDEGFVRFLDENLALLLEGETFHTGNILFSAQFDCRGYLWHSEEHPGSSCKSQRLAVELQRPFRLKLLRLTALLVAAELMLRCYMISIIFNRCIWLKFLVISESKQWKLFQAQSSQPTGLEIAIPGWWKWRTGYDGYVDLFCSVLFNLYLFGVAGFCKNINSVCVIIPRLFGDVLVEQCFERQDQMPELDIQLGAQCLRISQDQTE